MIFLASFFLIYLGTDLYFQINDGKAVTVEDFIEAMQKANGVDLSQFMLWYTQKGCPKIQVESHYSPENKAFTLSLSQIEQGK